MFIRLLGFFIIIPLIIIPLIELVIIVKIGSRLGFWTTLALIVLPGLLGAALARSQGLTVISRVRGELARGSLPGDHILDGLLILAAGLLLITPGIITDTAGLLMLFPGVRRPLREWLKFKLVSFLGRRVTGFYLRRW